VSHHAAFLECVLELMHTPYRWGGKKPEGGLDCSGLVTHALHKVTGLDWRNSHNTDRLWTGLPSIPFPRSGDLALYGGKKRPDGGYEPLDVEHVMVVLTLDGEAEEHLVVGACGGDSTTTTLREAHRRGARVQVRQGVHYRPDFRGYRKLPIE
jgi:hypothetical protein